jgi:hypothetical protein
MAGKRSTALMTMIALGMSGCGTTIPSGDAVCDGLRPSIDALHTGLLAHPETHDDVGEPGADVVIGFDAGC